ncbi:MAG: beta-lactamase family protein [Clostridia bacterium]|nr:beta-lactamase family protein [Clostridia bacterium]
MSPSRNDTENIAKSVAELTREYAERGYFPSASIRVFDREHTLYQSVLGDVAPDTVYDVASLTKIAVATIALILMEKGFFRLQDEIADCLPLLRKDTLLRERLSGVTLERLLTHTSGIVDWYPFYTESGDFYQALHTALSRCGPVEGMVYSDLNFMLLGKAIESAAGMPLDRCLQKLLTAPLDLGKISYLPNPLWDIAPSSYGNPIEEAMCAERGFSYSGWRSHEPVRGGVNDGNAFYFFGGVAGSAGIFAEPLAYQRLCQFHMNTDSPLMLAAQQERAPGRGLGWQMGPMYPDGCGHTGFTGTSVYFSRKLNIGAVAFTNRLFYQKPNPNPTNDFRRALHETLASICKPD